MKSTTRTAPFLGWAAIAFGLVLGCHSKEGSVLSAGPDGGARGPADASTSPAPDSGAVTGQLDGAPSSALPALPTLTNVVATEREDSVGIDFDPVDDAIDYRVYALPDPSDVTVNANGSLTIKNAIYRCAGLRQTFDLPTNLSSMNSNGQTAPLAGSDLVFGGGAYPSVTAKVPDSPTVGYVYVTPGAGLVPVYAVGIYPTSDEGGWRETRPKIYTSDITARQSLLGQGGRDDGIVFYVPESASAATHTIYHSEAAMVVAGQGWTQHAEYYFQGADLASHQGDSTPPLAAFQVLTAAATGSTPLLSVLYQSSQNHTELAVGKERFKRAAKQGPGPLWHVEWSGITKATTLVVEALATGCPYQGFLAPQAVSASPHQPFLTLDQIQQTSETGEVFINGQYDLPGVAVDAGASPLLITPDAAPVPVARSYVQVAPQPHDPSAWDWYQGFNVGSDFGAMTPATDTASCACQTPGSPPPCNSGSGACGYWTSQSLDIGAYEVDNPSNTALLATGQFLGQFWDAFDDWAQDVTSTLRFTAPQPANVDADASKFLHITWTVNTVGTDRRYPQLIVSDQPEPIQDGFANANSNVLLIQPILGPSMRLEAEAFHGLFNGKPWAVNNQAPDHALIDYDHAMSTAATTATIAAIPPAEPPFEHAGMDRMTKYDAYVSSSLLYVFMDGAPAGCMRYPSNGFELSGKVTVTFGDVMYHEGAPDELVCAQARPYAFMHEHQCSENKRHWDDLGFKSGVVAPKWDATIFPCSDY